MITHTTTGSAVPAIREGLAHDGKRPAGLVPRSVAEGAGSFLVILAGLGATMLATETSIQPSLVFGFAVVAAMIAFGHVSGGHFNPAITIGSALAGRTAWRSVVPYLLAQVVGALAASGLIWLVLSANPQLSGIRSFFSSASNGFGEHSPAQFPLTSAFLLEVVATALLVAVFLGATARRGGGELAPFAVGLTFAGLLSFLLPVTNGALNPLRASASAVFAEPWALGQLWLFWAAPLVGGAIAGLVYRSVRASGTRRPSGTASSLDAADAEGNEGAADSSADAPGTPAAPDAPSAER
ncbi:Bacterial nodulin-like intrinsic protein [Arthrobacter agilis]|uniref:aquaporin n=1 Tax=Arthrobacter agilis TaxID=37921 RepID=UPI000F6F364A|nr:aquaporin [Arthrobacter agilis]VDR32583.1 Bacterial nodulin-like intrinsic protein [Arthrobacter agilis]